jgi:hypothetical protein
MVMAGLWEVWRDKTSGEERRTCAVLTCGPSAVVGDVHNRMPCILGEFDWANGSAESPPPRTNCWRCCGAAGAFQMPVWMVLPCQVTSRGTPTLTESKRAITFLPDDNHRNLEEQKARPAHISVAAEKQWRAKLDERDKDDCNNCRDGEYSAHSCSL